MITKADNLRERHNAASPPNDNLSVPLTPGVDSTEEGRQRNLRLERFIAAGSSCRRRNRLKDATLLLTVLLSAFLSFSGSAAMGQPATEPAGKLRTLTTALEAHSLSSEEAARAYPVHLRGVVTYYDPNIGSHRAALYIHDATGTIYVEAAIGMIWDLSPGTLIEVNGVTGPGEFGPIVAHPQIKVIGRSALPANPTRPSLTLMKTGILDSQWIEVEGLIHSVAEYRHNVMLQLEMDGETVSVVMVKEAGANYSAMVPKPFRDNNCGGPAKRSLRAAHHPSQQVIALGPGQRFVTPRSSTRKSNPAMARLVSLHSRCDARNLRANGSGHSCR